jgi:hypothetical protein
MAAKKWIPSRLHDLRSDLLEKAGSSKYHDRMRRGGRRTPAIFAAPVIIIPNLSWSFRHATQGRAHRYGSAVAGR